MVAKKRDAVADPVRDKAIEVSDGIVAALAKTGTVATRQPRKFGSAVAGGCSFVIVIGETSVSLRLYKKSRSLGGSRPGGFRLEIGAWSDAPKRNIPEPKSGFRCGDIAVTVAHIAAARRALNDRAARDNAAAAEAAAINADAGVSEYGAMRAATNGHGALMLECKAHGTREQIVAMLRLAVELGMVESSAGKKER